MISSAPNGGPQQTDILKALWYGEALSYATGGLMVKRTISVGSHVVATKAQVSTDLGGEVAILNLEEGKYYGLEAVGSRIWSLVQEPRTVGEIRDVLVREYD